MFLQTELQLDHLVKNISLFIFYTNCVYKCVLASFIFINNIPSWLEYKFINIYVQNAPIASGKADCMYVGKSWFSGYKRFILTFVSEYDNSLVEFG